MMKKYLLLLFILIAMPAWAQNTPPGVDGQFVYNNNGKFGAKSPNLIRGIAPAQFTTVDAFGDHNTIAPNTPPPGSDYGTVISNIMNASYNNYGVDTTLLCDSLDLGSVYSHQSSNTGNPLYLILPSTGDPQYGNGSVPHEGDVNACYQAAVSWLSVPSQYRVVAQNASCVKSGSWTNDSSFGGTIGVTTHTHGDTLTCTTTTYGGPIYAWMRMHNSDGGTFTYAVDGGTPVALTTAPNVSPLGGVGTFGEKLIRVPSLSAGAHTIVFTVTSTTNASNNVYILGVGTPANLAYQGGGPTVFAAGQPYRLNNTYSTYGDAINTLFKQSISLFQTDGLNANFTDVRKYVGFTSNDLTNDTYLSAQGELNVATAFSAGVQYIINPASGAGGYIDPRDNGAACNAQNFMNSYSSPDNSVTTTSGSPVISILGYDFVDGVATQTGGGDVGKVISIFNEGASVGPTTYILSVDTSGGSGHTTATVGANMLASTVSAWAVMGGYPTNSADPSTAIDDTTAIHDSSVLARSSGGKVFLPNNCLVHKLTMATGTLLQGSMGGTNYQDESTTGKPITNLYCSSNGRAEDPNSCINLSGSVGTHDIRFQDFQLICTNFPFLGFSGQTLAGFGATDPMYLHAEAVVLDHVTTFLCPVAFGVPLGQNFGVSFTASITGTDMNVTAISSGNFRNAYNVSYGIAATDWLAVGRAVTGAGVTAGTRITVAPADGGLGHYTLNNSQTVGSEAMTSGAANVFMDGQFRFSQINGFGIGINSDLSDFSEVGSTFTGAAAYIGPNTGGATGNSTNRFSLTRFEEANGDAVVLYDTADNQFFGVQWQFNAAGYAFKTKGTVDHTSIIGGMMQGNGSNLTYAPKNSHINFTGVTTNFFVSGMQFIKEDFAFGGTTGYIFSNDAGAITDYISLEGGDVRNGYNTALTNYTVTPTHRKVDVQGVALLDTTQSTVSINSSSAVGIGTASAAAGTALDLSANTTTGNSSLLLPIHTTVNRPSSPTPGMLAYNSTNTAAEVYYNSQWNSILAGSIVLNNFISGLALSNDLVTPNTIFDIASGGATSDDNTVLMSLGGTLQKTISSWTVGEGLGCLDTGAVANSTWYYVFLIKRTDTSVTDALCSASITAPVMPANYTVKRLVGFLKTDGSAHFVPFTQHGNTYTWATPTLDLNTAVLSTSAVLETLNVPPGLNVQPLCRVSMSKDGDSVILANPDEADAAPSNANPMTAAPGQDIADTTIAAGVVPMNCPNILTNTSAQVRARSSGAATTLSIVTRGYAVDLTQTVPLNPIINLDFTTGTMPTGVTFTRASTGWYFNSSGNLTSAATDVPRFDYGVPGGVVLFGLLTEKASTNNLLWSRDLTQASWTPTNATVALDQTGINGSANTASSITATSSSATVCQTFTHASAPTISTVYLKRISGSGAVSITQDNNSTTTATVLTGSWQRFSKSQQTLTNPTFCVNVSTSGDVVAMDVAQSEVSGTAQVSFTSPIITTSATVTRAGDSVSITPTPWYNKSSGAIRFQYRQSSSGTDVVSIFGFNNSGYGLSVNNSNASFCGVAIGSSLYNATEDAACSYSAPGGVFASSLNGVSKGTGGAIANTATSLSFSGQGSSWAQKFQYWPYPLTLSQLQSVAP